MLEESIKHVNSKLQQLLKRQQQLHRENEQLSLSIKKLEEEKLQHLETIGQLQLKLNILKSSTGSMTEQEKKLFDKEISGYIKEIDKCVALISE
jgi:chromosome segregation ATPase